ncbi:MAG TPA: LysM domain-containing protein [Steroidobacteraceae bacterium]|nr:LysM domain-containing protein [Steroidobacteraceae bacterium]
MSSNPPAQASGLAARLDAEVRGVLTTISGDLDLVTRAALASFFPLLLARVAANEAAAVAQMRELAGMFARIAPFNPAELASDDQVNAEYAHRHPAPPPPPRTHTVVKGEDLNIIAAAYHVPLQQLEQANPRAGHPPGNFNDIWPGDVLVIP